MAAACDVGVNYNHIRVKILTTARSYTPITCRQHSGRRLMAAIRDPEMRPEISDFHSLPVPGYGKAAKAED